MVRGIAARSSRLAALRRAGAGYNPPRGVATRGLRPRLSAVRRCCFSCGRVPYLWRGLNRAAKISGALPESCRWRLANPPWHVATVSPTIPRRAQVKLLCAEGMAG